ncbi:MAG: hypothetical protein K0Q79_2923 [Flavipsychrobacter sp.]|jgi:hypothetical protein|nr:hypothetical protein [Flavipsychrobacter sp.]
MKQIKFLILFLLSPFICLAWSENGHNMGGAIAYYYLKANKPATIDYVVNILKQHPWYNTRWQSKLAGLNPEQKKVTLFMLASTFPDDARDDYELGGGEKTKWHYVDYPVVPAGSKIKGKQPERPNAEEVITKLLSSLKKQNDPKQKALDVCWLFHLIEDIHQPLHAASLFDEQHRDGDKGGNLTYIIFNDAQRSVKLHSYWDRLIPGSFAGTPSRAQELLQMPEYREAKLYELKANTTVKSWIFNESYVIAKEQVYEKGRVNGTEDSPTGVDVIYGKNAKKTAERRVVLAGIRIGKELAKLF